MRAEIRAAARQQLVGTVEAVPIFDANGRRLEAVRRADRGDAAPESGSSRDGR